MNPSSTTHLVLIPSYNSGDLLLQTVRQARAQWRPVWVVVDGSTDGSGEAVEAAAAADPGLRVLRLTANSGKGAAIHHGLGEAARGGFSHVLTMDADGQHPAGAIRSFMAASQQSPDAMILGVPAFGEDAPLLRVRGRRISNWWVNLETLWIGIADSLFGFRVYPISPLLGVMDRTRWMRRFDFDPEAAVRLSWAGVPAVNLPAPVRYLRSEEGGISHFHYLRDNLLLTAMHLRLMLEWLGRWPVLYARNRRKPRLSCR
jgi:glycosyltransferase involved in cell wall biosynthesis